MSDSDADEYVYLGTPLQGSDQVGLPVNQQTVRDAAGRQRLHGAFTGGYSAGFYNTVGSQVSFCHVVLSRCQMYVAAMSTWTGFVRCGYR